MNAEDIDSTLEKQSNKDQPPKAYLKGINGLRAIFIIAVVMTHIFLYLEYFDLDPYILGKTINGQPRYLDIGIYGLGIFFGISGFLITYLLRLERDRRGKINIKRFYVRRALRLFPLYYTQIFLCLILYHIFDIEYTRWALMIYAFYAVNIPYLFGGELPLLGHYWSLAVEEQFYLFWPWLNKLSNKLLLKVCWFLLSIFLFVRHQLMTTSSEGALLKLMDHVWFQCMLIGAIFALYYLDNRAPLLKIAENTWVQLCCWGLLFVGTFNVLRGNVPFHFELTTIAGCLIMINQNSNRVFVKLENRLFNYLGRVSYAIYIVHNAIIFLCGKLISWELISNRPLRYILVILAVFSTSILIAHVAHILLEKPFLKLKERKFTYVHGMKS